MSGIISEELFKLRHRKITWILPLILIVLMIILSFREKEKFFFVAGYGAFEWIMISMISIVAITTSMEFQYGTIKRMIVDTNGRNIIYFAKYLVMLMYSIFLHIIAIFVTLIINYMPWGSNFALNTTYQHSQTLIQAFLIGNVLDIFSFLIIISAVFLIAICSTTSSIAVLAGVAICFMGQGFSRLLIFNIGKTVSFIKWNPFNMMNFIDELNNHHYFDDTGLTVVQLFWGNIVYSIIFILLGLYFFDRKKI
ncbi:ABC transporter permease [Pediococcus acidilactici]